jgi:hypothetical protein
LAREALEAFLVLKGRTLGIEIRQRPGRPQEALALIVAKKYDIKANNASEASHRQQERFPVCGDPADDRLCQWQTNSPPD